MDGDWGDGDDDWGAVGEDLDSGLCDDEEDDPAGGYVQRNEAMLWQRLRTARDRLFLKEKFVGDDGLHNDIIYARGSLTDLGSNLRRCPSDALEAELFEKLSIFLEIVGIQARLGRDETDMGTTMWYIFLYVVPFAKTTNKKKMKKLNKLLKSTLDEVKLSDFCYEAMLCVSSTPNTPAGEKSPALPLSSVKEVNATLNKPQMGLMGGPICVTGKGVSTVGEMHAARKVIEDGIKMLGPFGDDKLMIPAEWTPHHVLDDEEFLGCQDDEDDEMMLSGRMSRLEFDCPFDEGGHGEC